MIHSTNAEIKKWPCSNCGKIIPGSYQDLLAHAQEDIRNGILSPAIRRNREKEKKRTDTLEARKIQSNKTKNKHKERRKNKEKLHVKDGGIRNHPLYKNLLNENQKLRQILKVRGIDLNKAMRATKFNAFYQSTRWRELRYDAMVKNRSDNGGVNKCCSCGVSGKETMYQVDHIKPRYSHPSLEYDPKNLQVLCADCNIGKGRKLN